MNRTRTNLGVQLNFVSKCTYFILVSEEILKKLPNSGGQKNGIDVMFEIIPQIVDTIQQLEQYSPQNIKKLTEPATVTMERAGVDRDYSVYAYEITNPQNVNEVKQLM